MFTVAIVYEYVPFGSLNVIVVPVPEYDCPLLKLTYHIVPDGNPPSVNVIVYVIKVNFIAIFTFAPFIIMVPEDGDARYPDIEPMVYEYVPLGSVNVIVLVKEDCIVPFKVTDHDVPDGRPDSVNVTV